MKDPKQASTQMALEALESIRQYGLDTLSGRTDGQDDRDWQRNGVNEMTKRTSVGITALREALAQPQGDWVDLREDELETLFQDSIGKHAFEFARAVIAKFKAKNTPIQREQQEPVAHRWICVLPNGKEVLFGADEMTEERRQERLRMGDRVIPLYTTSPDVEAMRIETLEKAAKALSKELARVKNITTQYITDVPKRTFGDGICSGIQTSIRLIKSLDTSQECVKKTQKYIHDCGGGHNHRYAGSFSE